MYTQLRSALPRRPLHRPTLIRPWITPDTDQFGGSLSIADETLAVGGAGFNSSAGAAYIFTISRSGVFQSDQRILHPEDVGRVLPGVMLWKY